MAKTIKSLLRISMGIRNLGSLASCTITKRFVQTSIHCSIDYNKDTLVTPKSHLAGDATQELSDSEVLQATLKNCNLTTQVFNIIAANEKKMSTKDAICALNTLYAIENPRSQRGREMYKRKEFLTLCEILNKNIRHIDLNDCISTLKVMIYFDVPSTSIIVQMILQMIRNSVNNISLSKITFLVYLLRKCENSPLVEALIMALPIVYENKVLMELDRDNINSIVSALKFLSRGCMNPEIFNVIFHSLKHCKQPMNLLNAKTVFQALCDLRCYLDAVPDIANHVQNILAQNITSLDRVFIKWALRMVTRKIHMKEQYFYHEGFADACGSTVISDDWGFTDAIYVLKQFTNISHTQISLLDYIAGKCFEDPTLLERCAPREIATLIHGLSAADYKPVFWDVVQKAALSDRVIEDKTGHYSLSQLAISLLSLDCYCPKLLGIVFKSSASTLSEAHMERGRTLLLYQAVLTLYPQYVGPMPVKQVTDLFRIRNYTRAPLLQALESALGGSRYVLTNIRSKLGHFIDHAVIMRKGGFPIAINNESNTETESFPSLHLEDIKPIADGQVILISYVPAYAYSTNTQRMKGNRSLQIKTLEALSGYTVIPISSTMWRSLPESGKIPYLMQAIRLKCDEESMSANS